MKRTRRFMDEEHSLRVRESKGSAKTKEPSSLRVKVVESTVMQLHQIVPWGRSLREYESMFDLKSPDLERGVLDCGGGPASFTAELHKKGHRAVAVDPIFAFPGSAIQDRFVEASEKIMTQVRAAPDAWVWKFHPNPDSLLETRRSAMSAFLADYDSGLEAGRYVAGELPALPFASNAFGLSVCSHLLFLYSDHLTEEFHIRSVREMCRISGEVRIFPLLTLAGNLSPHLNPVLNTIRADGVKYEIVEVPYELQPGGNRMLKISRG